MGSFAVMRDPHEGVKVNIYNCKLSVSDWISFLGGERDVAFNTVLNIGVLLLTIVGLIFATKTVGAWQIWSEAAVAVAFTIYAFNKVINPFGERAKRAEKLLKRILSGELNDSNEIQKAWLKIRPK